MDLHVHLTEAFPIERMVKLAEERGATFGIVEHPAPWAIKDDADLRKYVQGLRRYPVYVGLQPMTPGWQKGFSAEALAELDYVLMDPQSIPLGNGDYQRIWELQTYVEDTEEFMRRYMAHCLHVLEREPIQIFGWPLFLPVCIAREYYSLWTHGAECRSYRLGREGEEHRDRDQRHGAHPLTSVSSGWRRSRASSSAFGSDSRTRNAGRLSYCKAIARRCGLTKADFYVPRRRSTAQV